MQQNEQKMASDVTTELQFEQALEALQGTVRKLESGELSLEQSLASFEEGIRLTRLCQGQLTQAEQKIELLSQSAMQAGRVETQPMPQMGSGSKNT
jgi:exodeoxyribonuclease VII small subunit